MTTTDATIPLPRLTRRRRLRREIGVVGLLFTSVGSIIGSGWLFGALSASKIAGPAALLSWAIGGGAVILLALIHAELGGMYPVAGGSARIPRYAFGSLVGFAAGWFAFLGAVTTAPIEVEAALQYSTNYVHGLTHLSGGTPVLTTTGYLVAAALMLLFSVINVMGVKWLSETNKAAVWWKIAIPLLAVTALLITAFHPSNFSADGGFMPFGWKGSVHRRCGRRRDLRLPRLRAGDPAWRRDAQSPPQHPAGGDRLDRARRRPLRAPPSRLHRRPRPGEPGTRLDRRDVHRQPSHLWPLRRARPDARPRLAGDAALHRRGHLTRWHGPLYVGTSSRISFALARNRYIPGVLARLSVRGVPLVAIAFSFVCGMIVFLPFPGWQELVGSITSATVLAYAGAPLALGALRGEQPDAHRSFHVPAAGVFAPAGFAVADELILFSGWAVVWKLLVAIAIGFALLGISVAMSPPERRPAIRWRAGMWLWPYLIGLGVISYLSSFDTDTPSSLLGLHGPTGTLPFAWDVLVMAAFSVVIYALAMRLRLPRAVVEENVGDLTAEAEEIEAELAARGGADSAYTGPAAGRVKPA